MTGLKLGLALGLPLLLALLQQQLLLRQPPRLVFLRNSDASSGPGSLDLRFSRPMDRASVAASSRLNPPLSLRWLGSGNQLKLSLDPGSPLAGPITLNLAGRDRRGQALHPSRWRWDPRPRIVAVVPVAGGEQLQLQHHDGAWLAISPVWPQILAIEPLGDGSGVALVSRGSGGQQVWRIPVRQLNLVPAAAGAAEVQVGAPRPLGDGRAVFAHLSSNRRGDLLVQRGAHEPGTAVTQLWPRDQHPRPLALQAGGPMRLLPQGGAVVLPSNDGLTLVDLPPRAPRSQTLPGSRDLSSFCPRSGRALLVRHWPDFRRSLELVEPGQAPRQLWLGGHALLASSCQGSGERSWLALVQGVERPLLTVLELDRRGQVMARKVLDAWELEPGTPIALDPTRNRLLLVLRPLRRDGKPPPPPQLVLLQAGSLTLQPLGKNARLAAWLNP